MADDNEPERGVTIEHDRVLIASDDGVEGEVPSLAVMGHGDWWVSVVTPEIPRPFDGVRFCCSGARSYRLVSAIALLDAVARGDERRIADLTQSIRGAHGSEEREPECPVCGCTRVEALRLEAEMIAEGVREQGLVTREED